MTHKRPGRTAKKVRINRLKERLLIAAAKAKRDDPATKLLRDIFEKGE